MKRKVLIYVCALLIGVVAYSCKPNDAKIQQEVKKVLTVADVDVTVKDGVATLTGIVTSDDAKSSLESLVKSVKDVKSVVNNIQVKVPEPEVVINPDEVLQKTITEAFTTAGINGVTLTVKAGEVTLTGDAKRKDLEKIMQIANEAQPKKVINQLKLK